MSLDAVAGLLAGFGAIYAAYQQAKENEKDLEDLITTCKMVDAFLVRHNLRLTELSVDRMEVEMMLLKIEGIIKAIQHHFKKVSEDNSRVWNWYRSSDYADRMSKWSNGLNNCVQTLGVFVSRDFETEEELEARRVKGAAKHTDPVQGVDSTTTGDKGIPQAPKNIPGGVDLPPAPPQDPQVQAMMQMVQQLQGAMIRQEYQVSGLMAQATEDQRQNFYSLYNAQDKRYAEVMDTIQKLISTTPQKPGGGGEGEDQSTKREVVEESVAKKETGGTGDDGSVIKKAAVAGCMKKMQDLMQSVAQGLEALGGSLDQSIKQQTLFLQEAMTKTATDSTKQLMKSQESLSDDVKTRILKSVNGNAERLMSAQKENLDATLFAMVDNQTKMEETILKTVSDTLKMQLAEASEELGDQMDKLGNDLTAALSVSNAQQRNELLKVQNLIQANSEGLEVKQGEWFSKMKSEMEGIATSGNAATLAAIAAQAESSSKAAEAAEKRADEEKVERRTMKDQLSAMVEASAKHEVLMKEQAASNAVAVQSQLNDLAKDLGEEMQIVITKVLADSMAELKESLEVTIVQNTERVLEKTEELKTVVVEGNARVEKELAEIKALIAAGNATPKGGVAAGGGEGGEEKLRSDGLLTDSQLARLLPFVKDDLEVYYHRAFDTVSVLAGDGEAVVPFDDIYMPTNMEGDGSMCHNIRAWLQEHDEKLGASAGSGSSLVVIVEGAAGLGKTTFTKRMARTQSAPPGFVTLAIDLGRARAELEDRRRRGQTVAVSRDLFVDMALPNWEQFYLEGLVTCKPEHIKQALDKCRVMWLMDGWDEIANLSTQDPVFDLFKTGMDRLWRVINSPTDTTSSPPRSFGNSGSSTGAGSAYPVKNEHQDDLTQYRDMSMFFTRAERQGNIRLPSAVGNKNVVSMKMRRWCRFDAYDYAEKYMDALAKNFPDANDDMSGAVNPQDSAATFSNSSVAFDAPPWAERAKNLVKNCINAGNLALWDGIPLMYDIICGYIADTCRSVYRQIVAGLHKPTVVADHKCPWGLLTHAVTTMYSREASRIQKMFGDSKVAGGVRSLSSLDATIRCAAKFAQIAESSGGDFVVDLKKDDEWSVVKAGYITLSNVAADCDMDCDEEHKHHHPHHQKGDKNHQHGGRNHKKSADTQSETTATASEAGETDSSSVLSAGVSSPRHSTHSGGGGGGALKDRLKARKEVKKQIRRGEAGLEPSSGSNSNFQQQKIVVQRYRFAQQCFKDYFFAWMATDTLNAVHLEEEKAGIDHKPGKPGVKDCPSAPSLKESLKKFSTSFMGRGRSGKKDDHGSTECQLSKRIKEVISKTMLAQKSAMSLTVHAIAFKVYQSKEGTNEHLFWQDASWRLLTTVTSCMLDAYKENKREVAASMSQSGGTNFEEREKWRQVLRIHPVCETLILFSGYATPGEYFKEIFKSTMWLPALMLEPLTRFGDLKVVQTVVGHMSPDQLTPELLKSTMLQGLQASQKFQLQRLNVDAPVMDDGASYLSLPNDTFTDLADDSHSDVLAVEYLRSLGAKVGVSDCVAAGQHLYLPEVIERRSDDCPKHLMEGLAVAVTANQLDCLETLLAIQEELYDENIYLGQNLHFGFTNAHKKLNQYFMTECCKIKIQHIDGWRYLLRLTDGGNNFAKIQSIDFTPMYAPACQKWEVSKVPISDQHVEAMREACPPGVEIFGRPGDKK